MVAVPQIREKIVNEIEVWKDIPGYEGLYQASSFGRIKSLDKLSSNNRKIKGKLLKASKDSGGYYMVKLYKDGIKKQINIARLILSTFSRLPVEKEVACHFPDSDINNNNITNLVWNTQLINKSHELLHGTRLLGEKHNRVKLKEYQVKEIIKLSKSHRKCDIAQLYNVSPQTIHDIIIRRTWKHIKI